MADYILTSARETQLVDRQSVTSIEATVTVSACCLQESRGMELLILL